MTLSFEKKVTLCFVAAAAMLLLVAALTYRSLTTLANDATAISRGHQVIEGLASLQAVVQGAENAQRGYLLTGDLSSLRKYDAARRALPDQVAQTRNLLSSDLAQSQRFERLAVDIKARLAFLQKVLHRFDTEGSRSSQVGLQAMASPEGQQTLDNVTRDITQLQAQELQWLHGHSTRILSGTWRAIVDAGSGIGLTFVLLALVHSLVMHEIGQRRQTEQALQGVNAQLDALATLDGLTGVKNRRAWENRLTDEVIRSVRYGTALSVLLLDVDRFKQYNDSFGHQAGDEVLRRVGHFLQEQARATDFVARYGGEEFGLILPNTDATGALAMAERLRHCLESASWSERPITASVGVATLADLDAAPDPSPTAPQVTLIAAADKALYASKANGRNRVTHARDLPLPG